MRQYVFAAVLGCAAAVAGSAIAAPPVEAFGQLPAISHVHLSPDGQYFSAIEPVNGRPTVVVFKLGDPNTKPIIFADPGTFAVDSRWVNNDRLVCFVYNDIHDIGDSDLQRFHRRTRTISVSISGKDPVILLKKDSKVYDVNRSTGDIVAADTTNPDIVYIGAFQWTALVTRMDTKFAQDEAYYNLYKVNVENGDIDIVEHGNEFTQQWIMDGNGHVTARIDEDKNLQYSVFIYDNGTPRLAKTLNGTHGEDSGFEGVTQDGTALVSEFYRDKDTIGAHLFPLSGSEYGATLFNNPEYDLDGLISDDWTGRIIGVQYNGDKLESVYFDPARQKLQHQLELALPAQAVNIESVDKAGVNVLVSSEDSQHPKTYWLYNSTTHHLDALATEYPDLQPTDLGAMKPYPYKARDGLDIHAYLTLPPGKAPHNLPVVIMPHGGPAARDALDFDYWDQFMASRGYAVLQPNFRGSAGYGYKFERAGDGEWGRKMQDDVSDGVKKLIADGIADPKRICIVGASYGGYSALAGATFTPDLYACAISYAGIGSVTNLLGTAKRETGAESAVVAVWRQRMGPLADSPKGLDDVSPASHPKDVKAPVLLMHSSLDNTVPIAQSELENLALLNAGKKSEFITIDGDDHYLNLATTRVRVLQEIEKFLDANIGH
jgi:dipeptidyl aminopeptidase/acylaminoacyl peptidase